MHQLYNDIVMEHFIHPRNVGRMVDADAVGWAGDAGCGDWLKLYLRIEHGRIRQATFLVRGCAAATAASSMTTVLLEGKTIEQAGQITDQEICQALGGLPEQKMHCSVLGAAAIHEALADYEERKAWKQAMRENDEARARAGK